MELNPTIARPPEVIPLPRLRLRRPRLSDASAIFEYAGDPEVARYADWPLRLSVEGLEAMLRAREADWNSGAEFDWAIPLPPSDQPIGGIACTVSGHAADFGFLLNRRFWGHGYATEAARAVLDWIFSIPSVCRVSATCDVENAASARVLEKVGLAREGVLRRAIIRPNLSNQPRDAFLYVKIRDQTWNPPG